MSIASQTLEAAQNNQTAVDHAQKPFASNDVLANYLTSGAWGGAGNERSFNTTSSNVITVNLTGLSPAALKLARAALEAWSNVANIVFTEVTGSAKITFESSDTSGAYSYSTISGNTIISSTVNIPDSWDDVSEGKLGGYGFQTYIHEIGHALGLGHQGDYNGSATYGVDNVYSNDSWQESVMSYFSQTENTTISASFGFVTTAMMADIIAIQNLYGAPGAGGTTAGDTVWGTGTNLTGYLGTLFNAIDSGSTVDVKTYYPLALTIYDQGGNDLIDLTFSTTNNRLDMNAETYSDIDGLIGNWAIARGTVIENATMGSGNDTVTGNAAANIIKGKGGNDTLNGMGGNDTIEGGVGSDILTGGAGYDAFVFNSGESGSDTITDYTSGANKATSDTIVLKGTMTLPNLVVSGNNVTLDGTITVTNGALDTMWVINAETDLNGRTIVSEYDLGNTSSYTSIHTYLNAAGVLTAKDTYFDDGTDAKVIYDYASAYSWVSIETRHTSTGAQSFVQTMKDDGTRFDKYLDAANAQTWTSLLQGYNASGQLTYSDVANDTGTRTVTNYDPAAIETWTKIVQNYNTAGQLYYRNVTNDNGTSFVTNIDADNTGTYTSILQQYTATGDLYFRRTINDDGTKFELIVDVNDTANWVSHLTGYTATGGIDYVDTANDSGTRTVRNFDVDNTKSWTEILQNFDSAGQLYFRRTTNDNGTHFDTNFDVNNTGSWASVMQAFNSSGEVYFRSTLNDNGTRWDTNFDVDNTAAWDEILKDYDAGGNLISTRITYDDGSIVYV